VFAHRLKPCSPCPRDVPLSQQQLRQRLAGERRCAFRSSRRASSASCGVSRPS
jgi:hypothetical protein